MIKWMETDKYLILCVSGLRPLTLMNGSEKYNIAKKLLDDKVSEEQLKKQLDMGMMIEEYSEKTFKVDQASGLVVIDNQEVDDSISQYIVKFCKENLPYLPLVNFWRNIQLNPSQESKHHLFLFLQKNNMSITEDGCFLAYKGVSKTASGDLVDSYTKKFCNNVGSVITMDRDRVDPSRNHTCSQGLHVAAFEYVKNSSYNQILEVKVNPKDVVAVPEDYDNQKMRVCRYEVVGLNFGKERPESLFSKYLERSKRKKGKKEIKARKNNIKKEHLENRVNLIARLKTSHKSAFIDLEKLTAKEAAEVVLSLTSVNVLQGLKDLKDKRNIVKRCNAALEKAGFTSH